MPNTFIPNAPQSSQDSKAFYWKEWYQSMWRLIKGNFSVAPAQTAAFTPTNDYFVWPCNMAAGAYAITLPPAADNQGKKFAFCKNPASINVLTVTPFAGDAVFPLSGVVAGGQMLVLISDGLTTWYRLGTS